MTDVAASSPAKHARPASRRGPRWGWGLSVAALAVAVALGTTTGPVALPATGIVRAVLDGLPLVAVEHGLDERQLALLWQLRLPRVVLGAVVGATLSCAGAGYQGVFRNPLADPYLLGVASGAGLAATVVIGADIAPVGAATLPLFAFVGAVAAVAATWALGRSAGGRGAPTIILAGIAVGSFLSAAQTFVMQRDAEAIRTVYSFLLGQLGTAGWSEVTVVLPWVVVALTGLLAARHLLDVLAVGDAEADALGISSARVRLVVVGLATLGTAAVVAVSGLIGFVGIVVPHAVRLLTGTSYRTLVPISLVAGAAFLVLADLLARVVLAPAELPIGVVTAFVGGPFFVVVLRRTVAGP